jgi:hypothetical protein
MNQGILISDLMLGVNQGDMQTIDFVSFGDNTSQVTTANLRLDLWLFPFLNVYGMYGKGFANTTVELTEPVSFESSVDQSGTYYGFGLTGAAGIKKNWLSVDFNMSWTDLEKLEEPVRASILGLRYGRTFNIGGSKRLAVWVGAMHQKFKTETDGSILLSEAIPVEIVDQIQNYQDSDWYQDLSIPQQALVDEFFSRIEEGNIGDTVVKYGIDKAPEDPWNLLVGANLDLNKHWAIRAEAGLIGRVSILGGLNFRFNL